MGKLRPWPELGVEATAPPLMDSRPRAAFQVVTGAMTASRLDAPGEPGPTCTVVAFAGAGFIAEGSLGVNIVAGVQDSFPPT